MALFSRSAFRLGRPTPGTVALGLGLGLLTVLMTHAGYVLLGSHASWLSSQVGQLYRALEDPPGPLVAAPLVVFIVFVEEIVWRGLLVDALSRRMSRPRVVVLASLAYLLPQIGAQSVALAVVATAMGLIWTVLRLVTGGLWAPLLCHLAWDLLIFYVWRLPVELTS